MSEELMPESSEQWEEEYEEISGEEVESVLQALDALMEKVESENIRACLEEASNAIFYLVYEDEDLDDGPQDSAEAA